MRSQTSAELMPTTGHVCKALLLNRLCIELGLSNECGFDSIQRYSVVQSLRRVLGGGGFGGVPARML